MRRASESFYATAQPFDFNYGVIQGDQRFLNSLANFLSEQYGSPAESENLFVTGGNSQALDLVSTTFASPGDTVFVEEPSYFLAFQILRDHDLNVVGIPMDQNGPCLDEFEKALQSKTPAFFYTIPSFHNPTGLSTSADRRDRLVKLAQDREFLIVADEPYQLLQYDGDAPKAYGTKIASDVVISLGSFSKILAPGMRLGWIQTSDAHMRKILASGFVNSGGCINHISSHIVRHAIESGLLAAHIDKLCATYRGRVEAMDSALHEHFEGLADWLRPLGGYFFWLRFDATVNTVPLRNKASDHQTGFQAGPLFSSNGGSQNCLRLCFAHYNEADILQGIARMRPLFD